MAVPPASSIHTRNSSSDSLEWTYDEAIAALNNFIVQSIIVGESVGLQRMRLLLELLDNPQLAFPTIHITGTVGKGSTAAMCSSMLQQAGYQTGRFTSPHLVDFTERIDIDGREISRVIWARYQAQVWPIVTAMAANTLPDHPEYAWGRPAFSEILWAMACLYFRDQRVDCAVVEVGMGGRLDATTVNAATVSVITTVGLDHVHKLGPTLAHIAAHKAGVIKPGGIVVTAAPAAARRVIAAVAEEQGATLWWVGTDSAAEVFYQALPSSTVEPRVAIRTPLAMHDRLRLGLHGPHQRVNAALAVAAVDAFARRQGLNVSAEAIRRGLADVRLAGRLETFPALLDGSRPEVILDGAHNPAGARALARALPSILAGRPMILLVGILTDKDATAMIPPLIQHASSVIVTEPPLTDRAGAADHIIALVHERRPELPVAFVHEPSHALAEAMQNARTLERGVVVVAGSLYLVGAIRPLLT